MNQTWMSIDDDRQHVRIMDLKPGDVVRVMIPPNVDRIYGIALPPGASYLYGVVYTGLGMKASGSRGRAIYIDAAFSLDEVRAKRFPLGRVRFDRGDDAIDVLKG